MVTEESLPTYHAAINSFVGYDSRLPASSADVWGALVLLLEPLRRTARDLLNR
jgi:acyl-[acyl-carrier-protein] desaturase